jgi:hypothetical protein
LMQLPCHHRCRCHDAYEDPEDHKDPARFRRRTERVAWRRKGEEIAYSWVFW